jgi:hypothetical protein
MAAVVVLAGCVTPGLTPDQTLFNAAIRGNLGRVQGLVKVGADINYREPSLHLRSPLYNAAASGHLDIVQYLVEQGADINIQTDDGQTPLMVAASNGHLDIVQYLKARGAIDFEGAPAAPEPPLTEDDFQIMQNAQGGVTITGYTGKARRVDIPASIAGLPVTAIADNAFLHKSLTALTIPEGVKTIGSNAFGDVSAINNNPNRFQTLVIPDSVTSIGIGSFRDCGIRTLTLGKGLTTIPASAFVNNVIETLVIPDSVTRIDDEGVGFESGPFKNCGIKTLKLGKGLQYIGVKAFSNNAIEALVIPDSVTVIGGGAFEKNSIKTLTLGKGHASIGGYAFEENQISELTFPPSLKEIGPGTFNKNQLTALVIPGSIARLGGMAFSDNPLASVTIASAATAFSNAFSNSSVTRLTLPANADENNVEQFGTSFVNFWKLQGKKAGTYVNNGRIWTLQ